MVLSLQKKSDYDLGEEWIGLVVFSVHKIKSTLETTATVGASCASRRSESRHEEPHKLLRYLGRYLVIAVYIRVATRTYNLFQDYNSSSVSSAYRQNVRFQRRDQRTLPYSD